MNIYTKKSETKKFGDVLRRTEHSVFGFKGDNFFASIMYGNSAEVVAECLKQGFTHVIMGDGGGWAACNTPLVDFNLDHPQYSTVQITNEVKIPLVPEIKKKWKYFDYSEFANSLDGGANKTKEDLIDKLDIFRGLIYRPITVTSGYRTVDFNRKVDGDSNSEHLYGLAADIRFGFNGYTKESLSRILKHLGFENIGFYWDGSRLDRLHVGIRKNSNGLVKIMDWTTSGRLTRTTYI